MKLSKYFAAVLAIGFSSAAFAEVNDALSVPKEYQGKWAEDCQNSSVIYTITQNSSGDEESDCKVRKVVQSVSAINNKTLNVNLECSSGEGGSSPSKEIWELTPEGKLSLIHMFSKTEHTKRILASCGNSDKSATPIANEQLLVSCNVAGNKSAQIVGTVKMSPYDSLEYRYGASDKPEMTFKASLNGEKMYHTTDAWDARTSVDSIWFSKGKFTYAIATCYGQCDENKSMALLVYEGKKRIARKICQGDFKNELDLEKPGAIVGKNMPTGISVADDLLNK